MVTGGATGSMKNANFLVPNAASANAPFAIALGDGAIAGIRENVSIGKSSTTQNFGASVSIGALSDTGGTGTAAIGYNASANDRASTAIGANATAGNGSGNRQVAIGNNASAGGILAVGIGADCNASGFLATYIGSNGNSTGDSSIGIGNNVFATANQAYVIGHNSATNNMQNSFMVDQRVRGPWGYKVSAQTGTFTPDADEYVHYHVVTGSGFTVNAPSNPGLGKTIRVSVWNTAGSGTITITWNAVFIQGGGGPTGDLPKATTGTAALIETEQVPSAGYNVYEFMYVTNYDGSNNGWLLMNFARSNWDV